MTSKTKQKPNQNGKTKLFHVCWMTITIVRFEWKKKMNQWKSFFAFNMRWPGLVSMQKRLFFLMPYKCIWRIKLFLSFHWIWQFVSIVIQCSQWVLIHESPLKTIRGLAFSINNHLAMGGKKSVQMCNSTIWDYRICFIWLKGFHLNDFLCSFSMSLLYIDLNLFLCSRNWMKCTSESHLQYTLSKPFTVINFSDLANEQCRFPFEKKEQHNLERL